MTPKEWAVLTVNYLVLDGEHCRLSGRHRDDWIANIEARVKAAIEEEREACAKLMKDESLRLVYLEETAKLRGDIHGTARMSFAASICEKMEKEIRARSALIT